MKRAKFNVYGILHGTTTYSDDFIKLVIKHKDETFVVSEEVFGGY